MPDVPPPVKEDIKPKNDGATTQKAQTDKPPAGPPAVGPDGKPIQGAPQPADHPGDGAKPGTPPDPKADNTTTKDVKFTPQTNQSVGNSMLDRFLDGYQHAGDGTKAKAIGNIIGSVPNVQTEPNGLIYMRGRFYSPAWHCFLNSDQGADPNQINQYAYAGGNPLTNIDPSGMSWLSDTWHDLIHHPGRLFCDPLSLKANWNQDREGVEIGAAVAVCIVIDIASDGSAAGTNSGIMASIGGTANAVGGAVGVSGAVAGNAIVGGVAGGFIGAKGSETFSLKGACEGIIDGATLGYGWNWYQGGYSVFANDMAKIFTPSLGPDAASGVMRGAFIGGVMNAAMGSPCNSVAEHDFSTGAFQGAFVACCSQFAYANHLGGAGIGLCDLGGTYISNGFLNLPTHISVLGTPSINGSGFGFANFLQNYNSWF